jgi:hypothetical protein
MDPERDDPRDWATWTLWLFELADVTRHVLTHPVVTAAALIVGVLGAALAVCVWW